MSGAQRAVIPIEHAKRNDTRYQEEKLRELGSWYEWSTPPNLVVASVLQDAADAVQVRALSAEAAIALIAAWQPFVGLEARVGNPPPAIQSENVELGVLKYAVKDLGKKLKEAKTPEDRRRLTKLLNRQIATYERAGG